MSVPLLDDRGQPVRMRRGEIMTSLEQRLPPKNRWLGRALSLLPLALVIGYFALRGSTRGFGWQMFTGPFIGLAVWGILVVVAAAVSRHTRRAPAVSATAVAFGHCGGCGYDLAAIPAASDGCAQCPECGGAWHTDRRTHVGQPAEALERLLNRVNASRQRGDSAIGHVDDRGVQLLIGYSWPRGTFSRKQPASAEPAIRLFKAQRRRRRVWCFAAAGAAWALLVGAMWFSAQWTPAEVGKAALSIAAALAVFAFICSFVSLSPKKVRHLSLRAARCPECFTPLEPASPQFDRCTVCRTCRAAWRAADVGPPPFRS